MTKSQTIFTCALGVVLTLFFCALFVNFSPRNSTNNIVSALDASQYNGLWTNYAEAWAENASSAGTAENPYIINTPGKLAQLAVNVNNGTDYAGRFFRIYSNIDLTGHYWVPIGNAEHPFRGTLTSNTTFSIKNMYISSEQLNSSATRDFREYVGLFGYVENMGNNSNYIDNLHFESPTIEATQHTKYAGVVAGYFNGSNLRNITINKTYGDNENAGAYIRQYSSGGSMDGDFVAGGLVGMLGADATLTASNDNRTNEMNTSLYSEVYNTNSYRIVLGGLVGDNRGTIMQSYRTGGEIQSYIGVIGGIVGTNAGTVIDCYNAGVIQTFPNVPSTANFSNDLEETMIGGLAGINSGSVYTENFSTLFTDIASQNVAESFQTCRGSIGGIVGLNRSSGTIRNVVNTTLVKCTGTSDNGVMYMGGIVAVNGGTVRECVNRGNIESDGGIGYRANSVGGIAGLNDAGRDSGVTSGLGIGYGVILACQNEGNIVNIDATTAGGIVGTNYQAQTGRYNITAFDTSSNAVGVVKNSGQIRGVSHAGGIVGYNFGRVNGAYNTGAVYGANTESVGVTTTFVGGVVGCDNDGTFEQCFNAGTVGSGSRVGGFAGQTQGSIGTQIQNCANYGDVLGEVAVGGFVGYSNAGDFDWVFSIGDVDTVPGAAVLGLGGLVGYVVSSSSGTNTDLNNAGYSSSIANYQDSVLNNYDNGMNTIGNMASLFASAKYDSYSMVLPSVASLANTQFAPFYNNDTNEFWYFAPAEEQNNRYFYPILRVFKTGETNSLNVYTTDPNTRPTTGQMSYPEETIYSVDIINNRPWWNTNSYSVDHMQEPIGTTQYIVSGHYIAEPSESEYISPAGFDSAWYYNSSDIFTQLAPWDFNTPITSSIDIYLQWTEQTYDLIYVMQDYETGEFANLTESEITQYGLLRSVTYTLEPGATAQLTMIQDNDMIGYYYNGWWCFGTMPTEPINSDETPSSSRININTAYPEGVVYVIGIREAKTFPNVKLYPGSDRGTYMNFAGKLDNEPITITLTFGKIFDLSEYAEQLEYDDTQLAFKGWYSMETGGTRWTGPNSVSIYTFDHNQFRAPNGQLGEIALYAQWTGLYQEVHYVSYDESGIEQTLDVQMVSFDTLIPSIPTLSYFIPADIGGYEVDQYYADADMTTLFNFENTRISDTTYVYVTWKPRNFVITLNADGGNFVVDGMTQTTFTISNVPYKSNVLDILDRLNSSELPSRLGYRIHTDSDGDAVWSTASSLSGSGETIGNSYTMPATNINLYIMWDRESYAITFYAINGHFANDEITITKNIEYDLPLKAEVEKLENAGELDIIGLDGYGFKYWSLTQDGEELSDDVRVPIGGLTLYAVMGHQIVVTFKKLYSSEEAYSVVTIFEGEQVSAPTLDADFDLPGFDFVGWSVVMGVNEEDGSINYADYDFNTILYEDTILVARWQENTDAPTPVNTNMGLMISLIIIAVVVVILFVFILLRNRKKDLAVNKRRFQTKDSKDKLEQIRKSEERRNKDNPFGDEF